MVPISIGHTGEPHTHEWRNNMIEVSIRPFYRLMKRSFGGKKSENLKKYLLCCQLETLLAFISRESFLKRRQFLLRSANSFGQTSILKN